MLGVTAVARHLAEASFWMLTKNQDYRPPQPPPHFAALGNAATDGGFVVTLDSSTNG